MRECDLVLKGGITSGVVYPHAIAEIAGSYRLRQIGGTSAGAIAAALAAAAEYRRLSAPDASDASGFDAIRALAGELGTVMPQLFQPSPALKTPFDLLIAVIDRSAGTGLFAALAGALIPAYPLRLAAALLSGLATASIGWATGNAWLFALSLVIAVALALLVAALLIGMALAKNVMMDLPDHDFGLCPGLTQPGSSNPGMTDWIADKIDIIAGNLGADGSPAAPLSIGQLRARGIGVASVTTDLSSGRPYHLPLEARLHLFSRSEFEKLLPARVVAHMAREENRHASTQAGLPDDLYWLPVGDDFPVLLVARMSLSFPGLIQAVPLYRFDRQLKTGPNGEMPIRRCLFSDGGISSNFPIHFFDAFLPRRPTFGISLGAYEPDRHGDLRVNLPKRWRQGSDLAIRALPGLAAFLGSIVNTAKDWQDTLQSLLPGYAERIVEIRLDESREGGMNLTMSEETIRKLAEYGRQAGRLLVESFDFDEHRYRRALSLLPELEGTLEGMAKTYDSPPSPDTPDALTYPQVLRQYPAKSFANNSAEWRTEVLDAFAAALAALGRKAAINQAAAGRKSVRHGFTPAVDCRIRLVADADRVPLHARPDGGGQEG